MKDVEELLRETLADPRRRLEPTAGLYETVHSRAHVMRRNRWALASAAAGMIAVVAAVSTVAADRGGQRAQPAHRPSPSAVAPSPSQPTGTPPRGGLTSAIDVGQGWPSDAVMTSSNLYVLTNNPSQLVVLDAAGTSIQATASLPATNAAGLTVGDGRVWVWAETPGVLYAYDAAKLQPLGSVAVGADVYNAVAVDGELYLTTSNGLLRAGADQTSGSLVATPVSGIDGGTYGLAADPARHRVLVGVTPRTAAPSGGFAGMRVLAVDARSGKVVARSAQTSVGKESIAVVGDQVWAGGYGDTDKPRIEHLDATTLRVIGSSPVGDDVGPGAILWPGHNVLWVRNGGDESLSCVDPKTGAILEQWLAVQGPVISAPGHAYGIQAGLQPLSLSGACTG